jgi:CheY-like chemotaxis protein
VILSDINMPRMDGLTLLREIKQRRPDLPVMMVTAYGDEECRRQASDYGARRRVALQHRRHDRDARLARPDRRRKSQRRRDAIPACARG